MITRFLKLSFSIFFWTIEYIGKVFLYMLGKQAPATCVILYYHIVSEKQRIGFARQLDDILRWGKPISLNDNNTFSNDNNYVAVTFDDGFQSIIENALPELKKRHIPVTIFIPSGNLGKRPHWIDENNFEHQNEIVMTSEQIKNLDKDLVTIGSHCVSHSDLLFLDDKDAEKEILTSKEILEDILKAEINLLSFPHGAFSESHVQMARQAGYKQVFSILPTLAYPHKNKFVMGRVRVDPSDLPLEFRLKILGAYRWLLVIFNIKKKIRKFILPKI